MRSRVAWASMAAVALVFLVLSASAGSAVVTRPVRGALPATTVNQTAKLTASDGAANDHFGTGIAISGDTMVVGAPYAKVGANSFQGAAYVYVRPAGGSWADAVETAKLTASDGVGADFFGWSVAIDGNTIVVGAVNAHTYPTTGAVYVFTKPSGGWTDATQTAELTASSGNGQDEVGVSVAISGDTIVAGAPEAGPNHQGAAYVFVKSVDLGWVDAHESASLTASDSGGNDFLGSSVGISGDTVVAGAPNKPVNAQPNAGAAYVFSKPGGGWTGSVVQTAELTSSSPQSGEHLGWGVGISGGTIVAGAPWAISGLSSPPGSAYVFVEPAGGWADGHQTATLTASDGANMNHLGASAAIDGDTIAVGAPSGGDATAATYSFTQPAGGWADGTESAKLTASDGATGDGFGSSVSIAGGTIAAGAPNATVSGQAVQGAAYVFAGVAPTGPTAAFTMPSQIRAGAITTLDATSSLNAKAYNWDLNGDGHTDVSCSTPELQTQFMPPPGVRGAKRAGASLGVQVRLTVVGQDNTTSTTAVSAPFSGSAPIAAAALNYFNKTDSAYCMDFKKAGICVTPATLTFSVIEATGCDLHQVTGTGDAPDDSALVQTAINEFYGDPQFVTYVKTMCAYAKQVADPASCNTLVSHLTHRDIGDMVNTNSITLWESHGPVKIDGLEFRPAPGHAIVVSPLLQTIFWSDAEVDLNDAALPLPSSGSLSFKDVNAPLTFFASADRVAHLRSFDAQPGMLPGLAGLVPESVDLSFVRSPSDKRFTRIDTTLALPLGDPWKFALDAAGTTPVTVTSAFTESNSDGLQLADVHGQLSQPVDLGTFVPLKIDNLKFDYWNSRPHTPLDISGAIEVGDAPPGKDPPTLSFAPTALNPGNGIHFLDGAFSSAGASFTFSCPTLCPPDLFPGVTLDELDFGIGLKPTVITGGFGLSVLDLIDVNAENGLALAFPSDTHPWTLSTDNMPQLPSDWTPRTFTNVTLAVAGGATLELPVLKGQTLANAYFVYSFPGYVAFGGGVHWNLFDLVSFDGGLSGELNAVTKRFNVAGHLQTCVVDVLCGGAFGVVSSAGAGACFVVGPVSVGGGVQYARITEPFIWPVDGCKWSRFTEDNIFSRRRARAQARALLPYTVTIKAGDPSRVVRLDGSASAPAIEVKGPGGIDVKSSQGDCTPATPTDYNGSTCLTVQGNVRIMRSPQANEAVVGLEDPAPGKYTITPLPGSDAFAHVFNASDTANLSITGQVSGAGTRRALAYRMPSVPGEKVTFLDVAPDGGAQTIGTVVGGGTGTLSFTPSEGTAAHTVTAEVELAGIPVPMLGSGGSAARKGAAKAAAQPSAQLRIATFMPPKPVLPGAAKSLRAMHKGNAVTVTWAAAAHAGSYKVIVVLSDKTTRTVSTRRTSVKIPNISKTQAGTVSVTAVGSDGRVGRSRKAAFPALAKAPTLLAPFPVVVCTVPKLRGQTEPKADAALLLAGCAEGAVKQVYSSTVAKGRVISQSARPGTKLPLGATVNLVVSRGPRG